MNRNLKLLNHLAPLLKSANIKPQNVEKHFTLNISAWCMKKPGIFFDLHSGKNLNQIHTYQKMISEGC